MRKLITMAVLLLSLSTQAQNYGAKCTVDQFPYLYAYAQPTGGGIEAGVWPQDVRFGGGFGIALNTTQMPSYKNGVIVQETVILTTMYAKGIARINRYVYITGTAGVQGIEDLYLGIGTRVSVPMGRGTISACIVEPQYTTNGFNVLAGLGFALNP